MEMFEIAEHDDDDILEPQSKWDFFIIIATFSMFHVSLLLSEIIIVLSFGNQTLEVP